MKNKFISHLPRISCFMLLVYILFFPVSMYAVNIEKLDMKACIQIGISRNKSLHYQSDELYLSIQALKERYRSFYPQLNFSLGANNTSTYSQNDSSSRTLSINVSQLIYDGNKLNNELENARINLMLSALEIQKAKDDAILSIADSYLSLLTFQERIRIKESYYSNQVAEQTLTKKKYEMGEATMLELYEWQIEIKNSEMELLKFKKDYDNQLIQFKKLIGIDIDKKVGFTQRLNITDKQIMFEFNEATCISKALSYSPSLKKMKLSIKQAHQNSLQRNMFNPNISLTASYSTDIKKAFRITDQWNLGLQVTFPAIFDSVSIQSSTGGNFAGTSRSLGGNVSSSFYKDPSYFRNVKQEILNYDKLIYQYNETKKDITLETKKIIFDINFQKNKLAILKDKISLTIAKLLIYKKQYELGEIKLSELIEFENQLHSSKLDEMDSIYSYLSQVIKLYKLQGLVSPQEFIQVYNKYLKLSIKEEKKHEE